RLAALDDVEDDVRKSDDRTKLDRPVQWNDVCVEPAALEIAARKIAVLGRDFEPVSRLLDVKAGIAGERQLAGGEPEVDKLIDVRARLEQRVLAYDADVGDAPLDIDGHVAGLDEYKFVCAARVRQDELAGGFQDVGAVY